MHFLSTIPKAFPRLWFCFYLFVIFAFLDGYGEQAQNANKVNIGVIVDVNSRIGKEQQVAMEIAAGNYNNTSKKNKLALYFQTPTENPFKTISLAEDIIEKQKVELIIGMQTWQEAALMAEVGNQAQVPVISFAAPAISQPLTLIRWPFLVRLAHNGTTYIKCIADIVHALSWQRVVAIYEDDAFGGDYGMLTLLSEALQDVSSTIEHRIALPPASSLSNPRDSAREELLKLLQVQSRVFIVLHSSYEMVNLLFREAKEMGFVDRESAWIIPESIANMLDSLSKDTISNMEGALGIKTYFYENSSEYQDFRAQFRGTFRGKYPNEDNTNPGFYSLRAYDSIKIVTQAIDRIIANENSSNGSKTLLREISSSSFPGLSGYIQFDSGQLMQNPTLRIVNVAGGSYKELDLWTEESGFKRSLPTGLVGDKAAGWAEGFPNAVHWPGNLRRVPKGWNIPSKQKPMKIAVPGRTSFSKFVKVDYSKNLFDKSAYSGFCIEIFDMVRPLLGYDLPYDYYPINTNYPDLVQLVFNKTFDAVVGDITLLSERLQLVDFTVPYAESGLSIVVPAKSEESTWTFAKPFTWQLWAVTGGILIYTVLVVWYLERDPNPEFQGDWKTQIGTSLWFTFCSLFLDHSEKTYSNLTRAVMAAWLSLIFILSSSYTASLSSMLTVQQLKSIADIDWLKKNNLKIGFNGSPFIRTYLVKVKEFNQNNIINVGSEYNYVDALRNNSIAAAIIELPYEKVFISKNCKGFSGSTPTTRFGGLGFIFQNGSPVAKDVSRAILKLSEKGEQKRLEEKWLNPSLDGCSSNLASNGTESLKLKSFRVLYLISGATSTVCFLLHTLRSLNKRNQDQEQDGNNSLSCKSAWKMAVKLLAKQIYSRELNNNAREAQHASDSSSRWDYLSNNDSPQHQQAMASPLPEILELPPPPTALEMANFDQEDDMYSPDALS